MAQLYPIIDVEACQRAGVMPIVAARALLELQVPALQLRAKREAPIRTLALLRDLRALLGGSATQLFANDRPDLALLAGCDGVHLGQDDLPVEEARRFAPTLRVGISTHDLEQVRAALASSPDYVAFGPIFPTGSKTDHEPCVGPEALAGAAELARAAGIPLVAIGGIHEGNLRSIRGACDQVASISAWLHPDPDELVARARRLIDLMR